MGSRASPVLVVLVVVFSIQLPFAGYSVPGPAVDDPDNTWAPYGPMSSRLELRYFRNEAEEFTAFENGELDLTDWPVPASKYAQYDAEQDFVQSPAQGEYGMTQLDINMAPEAVWTNWLGPGNGCDFQKGNSECDTISEQLWPTLSTGPGL